MPLTTFEQCTIADSDGGGFTRTLFATLRGAPAIGNNDFIVI